MTLFKNSLGLKFVAVAIVFLIANATFVYLYFPPQHEADALTALRREIRHVTNAIGTSVAPALDFEDLYAVSARLSGFGSVPEVLTAQVYDAQGNVAASFPPVSNHAEKARHQSRLASASRVETISESIFSPSGNVLGHVSVLYSLDGVYARSSANRRAILLVTLLIVTANSVAMGLVSRQIAQPLRSLTKAAQKISGGDFELRLESKTRDEVGELTESFNVMTAYLVESRRLIEHNTGQLESLVHERTLELSRKNEELLLQSRRAEEASRLKSEFLANMSHELRTPLSSIIGFLSLILEGICEDEAERMDLLRDAHRSSLHLLSLINYLLDLTKIEAGRLEVAREPVDMATEFLETERLMGVQAKARSLELTFRCEEGLPDALADSERVRQVLINLVGNAVKFTHEGSVAVRAFRGENDSVVVEVSDTGIGIPKEKQSELFEKFTQVDGSQTRRYGGTGLGLALSKSLVELMGGTIELASNGEGHGTRVWFALPAAVEAERAEGVIAGEAQAILADSDPTAPLVLVVEDDPSFARYLYRVVRSGGFRAIVARTAAEALALAEEMRPIAMTVDLGLPEVPGAPVQTGVDVVARAAHFNWDCKIIVITGSAEAAARSLPAEGPGHTPIPIVRKPVSAEVLLRHLQSLPQRGAQRARRILVADDDSAMGTMVERITRAQGAIVSRAANGVAALEALRNTAAPIDLLLLDLDMPELDGFGVLREIARMAPAGRPEILVVTNYPELAGGANGHFLRAGHVWGVIPKTRLGEDPNILNRALARIARNDEARFAIASEVRSA